MMGWKLGQRRGKGEKGGGEFWNPYLDGDDKVSLVLEEALGIE